MTGSAHRLRYIKVNRRDVSLRKGHKYMGVRGGANGELKKSGIR